jgi:hypothetical protein
LKFGLEGHLDALAYDMIIFNKYFESGAHGYICNPSYLQVWEHEDCGLRPAWENSSRDLISKITPAK